jgi:hypothetical protein
MTNSNSNDRLDRVERVIEDLATSLAEAKNIANSNARTIQSILDNRESERLEHESRMQRLEDNLLELTGISRALTNMYVGLDENQPTILNRLMRIENKVDRILDQNEG